jgi:hypothetical protein
MPATQAKLIIREARAADAPAVAALSRKVYGKADGVLLRRRFAGQMNNFPEGQFVAEYEGTPSSATARRCRSSSKTSPSQPHSWDEITGGGFGTRARSRRRRCRLWHGGVRRSRLSAACASASASTASGSELCQYFELKGIVFGGRMPGYGRQAAASIPTRRIISMR